MFRFYLYSRTSSYAQPRWLLTAWYVINLASERYNQFLTANESVPL